MVLAHALIVVTADPHDLTRTAGISPAETGDVTSRVAASGGLVELSLAPGRRVVLAAGRRDDLVILLEYLPDREDAVLLTRDCRLDRDLGPRRPALGDQLEQPAGQIGHGREVRPQRRRRRVEERLDERGRLHGAPG